MRVEAIRQLMSATYEDPIELNKLTFPNLRAVTSGLACAVYNDEHLVRFAINYNLLINV